MLSEHPVLLTEPTLHDFTFRERTAEILFEEMQVPAAFWAKQAMLSAFAVGKSTALVVDIGESGITVGPVYEGYCLQKNTKKYHDVGGQFLNRQVARVLAHYLQQKADQEQVAKGKKRERDRAGEGEGRGEEQGGGGVKKKNKEKTEREEKTGVEGKKRGEGSAGQRKVRETRRNSRVEEEDKREKEKEEEEEEAAVCSQGSRYRILAWIVGVGVPRRRGNILLSKVAYTGRRKKN